MRRTQVTNSPDKTLQTTMRLSYTMRARLDDVRMCRARATGLLPPSLNDLLHEAIEELLLREAGTVGRAAEMRAQARERRSTTNT